MNIAVLGWGSLIWCPGSLRIKTRWREDGPKLPIEYARISKDGRLTLVIHPRSAKQPTYWATSELTTMRDARENLREREDANPPDIHYVGRDGDDCAGPSDVVGRVRAWLSTHADIEAAVWTGLPTNWPKRRQGRDFSPEDAVTYLSELKSARDETKTAYDRAREYIRNTPRNIQTAVRKAMRAQGWADAQLSRVLFEDGTSSRKPRQRASARPRTRRGPE